jgi:hypothetical protein
MLILDVQHQFFIDRPFDPVPKVRAQLTEILHLAAADAVAGGAPAMPALSTKKIKEALKDFIGLNPRPVTIKQFREAQDAVRDAIAQAEADETTEPAQDPLLELGEVKNGATGETILIKDYAGDPSMLHHFNGSPMINFIRGAKWISLDRQQVKALIATLNRWLNTGLFKASAPSQEPTP